MTEKTEEKEVVYRIELFTTSENKSITKFVNIEDENDFRFVGNAMVGVEMMTPNGRQKAPPIKIQFDIPEIKTVAEALGRFENLAAAEVKRMEDASNNRIIISKNIPEPDGFKGPRIIK